MEKENNSAAAMKPTRKNDVKTLPRPRTLTIQSVKIYFKVSDYHFRRYWMTQELKKKISYKPRQKEFTFKQTPIVIKHWDLTPEELAGIKAIS